jgi:hypothetical protein
MITYVVQKSAFPKASCAKLRTGESHARDRGAVDVCRKACASASLPDTDLELVGRSAVVEGIVQEIRGPERYHSRGHDVYAKAVEAYQRRCLAVFHDKIVFADGLPCTIVAGDPLDLMCAIRQTVVVRKLDLAREHIAADRGLYRPCPGAAAADKRLHGAISVQVQEKSVRQCNICLGTGICDLYREVHRAFTAVVAPLVVLARVVFRKVAECDRAAWTVEEHRRHIVQDFDDLGVFQVAVIGSIALHSGACIAAPGVHDIGWDRSVWVIVAPPDKGPSPQDFGASIAPASVKNLVVLVDPNVKIAIPGARNGGIGAHRHYTTGIDGNVIREFDGVIRGLGEGIGA